MKNVKRFGLVSVAVFAVVLLLAGCNQQSGSSKAGVVDMMKLMQSSQMKALTKSMMSQDKGSQTKLRAAYSAMQKAGAAVQKAKGKAAKAKAKADAKKAQANFNAVLTSLQKEEKAQRQKLLDKIKAASAKVASNKGLSSVYAKSLALYGNSHAQDVTEAVANQLGK